MIIAVIMKLIISKPQLWHSRKTRLIYILVKENTNPISSSIKFIYSKPYRTEFGLSLRTKN